MGLSSNARLLTITARLTSNEYESQQITNAKLRLATQSQQASDDYIRALNQQAFAFVTYDSYGNTVNTDLTANVLYQYSDQKNQYMLANASGQALVNITEELVLDDETIRYFMASKYPLYDENNEIIGTWGISRDITDRLKLENDLQQSLVKLSRLARVDDLSGLYNRRYFYEKLDKMSSFYSDRQQEGSFSLIVIDVDDMTAINEQFGQQNGDIFLRTIASIMLANCRKQDTCFRTGGDEFAIILPGCDKIPALGIAKRIVDAVASTPVRLDGSVGKITISAGVVVYDKTSNQEEFLTTAERKLNKSKRNGKNQASM